MNQTDNFIYRLFLSKAITGPSYNITFTPYVEVQIVALKAMYLKKKKTLRTKH